MIDFTLPQAWINPSNKEHVLLVANRIAEIRFGDEYRREPPTIQADGTVNFPLTNSHWLFPPTRDIGQPKGHWRLVGRYDSDEKLNRIVEKLRHFLEESRKADAALGPRTRMKRWWRNFWK